MSEDDVAQLSIGTLKTVLLQNHVNARNLLEKSELIARVRTLLDDERRERARDAAIRAREEEEIFARQHAMMEEHRLRHEKETREREGQTQGEESQAAADADGTGSPPIASETPSAQATPSPSPSPPKVSPPLVPSPSTMATLERNGLCVICQDEDANIAIVDCGYVCIRIRVLREALKLAYRHLAMCRSCSELVMKSSRECPLCRTRIVTEQRLLRIFKT
ncbi:hypothetical protein EWM64_g6063 [Hericium alpestre]|uniref:RING-type domain-containing protein n=1 Tax=Hericium alpestre TaxID=135208 RepID=A0A4Y9ZWS1_9AGAM|nr:hypothetical protein EWM64_g6063 [Hericium alpestre]